MSRLKLNATQNTPYVNLDGEKGVIEFSGASFPENTVEFYKAIFDWLKENFNEPSLKIDVRVELKYFNTGSSKCILDFFLLLEKKSKAFGHKVTISWFYNEYEEDMLEAGQAYETITKLPFKMVKISE